jgi:hypothetical protein
MGAGGKFEDSLVDGSWSGDIGMAEEEGEGGGIQGGVEVGMGAEGLEFGGEEEAATLPSVVERLFAVAITGEVEAALVAVPEGEGEHPVEAGEGLGNAPAFEGGEEDLGVGGAAPGEGTEFLAEVLVVVDLAVEGDDEALRGGGHGLVPGRREIEDGEPAVSEGDAVAAPGPSTIGPPVAERVGQAIEDAGLDSLPAHTNDAAHGYEIIPEDGDAIWRKGCQLVTINDQ